MPGGDYDRMALFALERGSRDWWFRIALCFGTSFHFLTFAEDDEA